MDELQLGIGIGDALLAAAAKGFIVLGAAAAFSLVVRRLHAAYRHLYWMLALASVLLIPILSVALPPIDVDILPGEEVAPTTTSYTSSTPAPVAAREIMADGSRRVSAAPESMLAAPAEPGMSWVHVAGLLWLAGLLAVLIHLINGVIRASMLAKSSWPASSPDGERALVEIGAHLNVRRPVRLLQNRKVNVPFSWGVRRPVVVLPQEADHWSADKLRCVLAHELAHVKRFDCLTQGIATLACAVHWFNPLAWRAAYLMRLEREKACDASVLETARTKASSYASHLLEIARDMSDRSGVPSPVVMMARRSQLEGRVLSILEHRGKSGLRRGPATAAVGLALLFVVALAAVHPAPAGGAVEVNGPLADDVIRRTFDVSPGGTLEIDADMGNISIESSTASAVEIEVRRRVRGSASEEDVEISFVQEGETVRVTGERVRRLDGRDGISVDFVAVVPRRFNVDLSTAGGNISVEDLDGSVEVQTAGGNLTLGSISGKVDAHTSGGNIDIDASDADVDATTSGGNIHLGRVGGSVDVRTSGGNITVEGVGGEIEAVTSGGQITARLDGQPQGDCLLETSGGGITVYLAPDVAVDLDAETSGGRVDTDVEVLVQGRIERGELRGTINGGGPRLVLDTAAGNIEIRAN